jgi:hypothetical protein
MVVIRAGTRRKARLLNEHTRHEIDEWIGRSTAQRSAVLSALFTQEQNNGF